VECFDELFVLVVREFRGPPGTVLVVNDLNDLLERLVVMS